MTSSIAIATPGTATSATTTWNIDTAHSMAEFKVRHMMIANVKGEFSGLSGVLNLDESDYTQSTVEASIPAASVRTVDDKLDAHLKNEDFLDVDKFPTFTFKSTSIQSTGGRNYALTGDLTIRGVTKSVILTVEDLSEPSIDPWGKRRIGLSGSTRINRKDFVLVGDDVTITLDLEFIQA